MMKRLDFSVREMIIENCRQATELADALCNDGSRHGVVREQAGRIKERIKAIEENCSVEKYDLYFSGEVGVGKSTAICHLTGLVDKDCLNGGNIKNLPLLKTASGRTTVCETRIIPTEGQSRIAIAKVPWDDFKIYVQEFLDNIYEPAVEMPTEIMRAIANMSGYPCKNGTPETKESDILSYLEKSGAQSLECTRENLFDAISRNINYECRETTEFVFSEGKFEDWLKQYMQKINDGKIQDVPFPEIISIYVGSGDFELCIPEYISSIVDTRGIDGDLGSGRKDVADSIIKKDAVSIMCDEIASFGANGHNLLNHVNRSGGDDALQRLFLLGLGRAGEIENVNDAADYKHGIEIKRSEAEQKMKEGKIPMIYEHIDCRNVRFGIKYTNDGEILGVDEAVCRQERAGFWLRKGLEEMYSGYFEETRGLLRSLKCLEQNEFSENVICKCEKYKDIVEKFNIKQADLWKNFSEKITQAVRLSHAGVVRGCVNRNGKYDKLDLYGVSFFAGGEEFVRKCETGKDVLIERLREIFDLKNEMERVCSDTAEHEIKNIFSKYYNDNCKHYKNCFSASMGENSIWDRFKKYWGDGRGDYRNRIIEEIIGELERQDIAGKLTEKDFGAHYKEDIGKILDI